MRIACGAAGGVLGVCGNGDGLFDMAQSLCLARPPVPAERNPAPDDRRRMNDHPPHSPRRSPPAPCSPLRPWPRTSGPSKPITYIVPFPAGGTTDILARLIGQKLGPVLGTTIVVDNKGGAGGSVGSEIASRAAPDGYTILGGTISSHAINVSLYPKIGYDPIKSFEPITLIGTNPTVLVVNQASPYKTLADVIAAGKAKKPLTGASAGSGTSQHLSLELLKARAGIDITHIPYKGSGAGDPGRDGRPGRHDVRHHRRRRPAHRERQAARARGLLGQARAEHAHRADRRRERRAGLRGRLLAGDLRAGGNAEGDRRPAAQRDRQDPGEPEIQERLAKLGMQGADLTTEQIAAFQKAEVAKWAAVIKSANIKLE